MRSCQQQRPPRGSNSWPAVDKSASSVPQRAAPKSSNGPPPRTTRRAASSRPASSPSTPPTSSSLSRVYLQVTPLEGLSYFDSGPAQLSPHAVVILEMVDSRDEGEGGRGTERDEQRRRRRVFAFDFLPREPQRLSTALALFSGKPVEATGRERRLARVPQRRCALVGEGGGGGGEGEEEGEEMTQARKNNLLLAAARAKLRAWDATKLLWRRYDCTHAAIELAAELAKVESSVARRALEMACSS